MVKLSLKIFKAPTSKGLVLGDKMKKSLIILMMSLMLDVALAGKVLRFSRKIEDPARVFSLQEEDSNLAQKRVRRYFVVQFKNMATEELKKELNASGIEILQYIPDDAFIVFGELGTIEELSAGPEIEKVVPFVPSWKIGSGFGPMSVFNRSESIPIVLKTFHTDELDRLVESIPTHSLEYASGHYLVANVSHEQVLQLANAEGVHWIQPYHTMSLAVESFTPMDQPVNENKGLCEELSGMESGTQIMNFESAWAKDLTGRGQTVTVADTGLDLGKVSDLPLDFRNVTKGFIFGFMNSDWGDRNGHGTHVSGSVAANGSFCDGKLKGGAFEANLMMEGMFSEMRQSLTVPAKFSDLFEPAFSEGSRIHTNSWGDNFSVGIYDGGSFQVDQFMWEHPDFLILFAAGNLGLDVDGDGRIDPGSVTSPGTAKNALTVGASENLVLRGGSQRKLGQIKDKWRVEPIASDTISNNPDGIAAFSSRGPTNDGRTKPDVVAPGTNILSNASHMPDAGTLWGRFNEDFNYSGGTSMSTPLVAGGAAILRQYLIEFLKIEPSAALIKAILMITATEMYPGQFGEVGAAKGQEILTARPNGVEGYGRANMASATDLTDFKLIDERLGVQQGGELSYDFESKSGSLKALLLYTDAPADPNVELSLVNDLDLQVRDPSGQVHKLEDRINNGELIEINDRPAGIYHIVVKGIKIPQGKEGFQPFALVVSE